MTTTSPLPAPATNLLYHPSPLSIYSVTASSSPIPGLLGYLASAFDSAKNCAHEPHPPAVADALSAAYVLWCGRPTGTLLRPSLSRCEYLYSWIRRGRSIARQAEQVGMFSKSGGARWWDGENFGVWGRDYHGALVGRDAGGRLACHEFFPSRRWNFDGGSREKTIGRPCLETFS